MSDNKIVHRISLEGAEKVAKQLESIALEGDKSESNEPGAVWLTPEEFALLDDLSGLAF